MGISELKVLQFNRDGFVVSVAAAHVTESSIAVKGEEHPT